MNTDSIVGQTHLFSRAPVRIDLAGGTVDIWPLFLLLDRPTTVNVGIDLYADTELKVKVPKNSADRGTALLRSQDQKVELRIPTREIETANVPPTLILHQRLLAYFLERRRNLVGSDLSNELEITLSTLARSPAGAGLGGSSALSISLIGALEAWAKNRTAIEPQVDGDRLITVARDIETRILGVPAGLQDYFGAMYGGLQSIAWNVSAHQRSWLAEDVLNGLESRLLVFYSGQSRNSGINNWLLFKGLIDKDPKVREKFELISRSARLLDQALRTKNWIGAGDAIADEWAVRRTLAEGISIPEIDRAFDIAAAHGVRSVKICGAGGGGCFFVFVPNADSELKEKLLREITEISGVRSLSCRVVSHGLQVQPLSE